jgi:RecA-family ATPase
MISNCAKKTCDKRTNQGLAAGVNDSNQEGRDGKPLTGIVPVDIPEYDQTRPLARIDACCADTRLYTKQEEVHREMCTGHDKLIDFENAQNAISTDEKGKQTQPDLVDNGH